MSTLIFSMLPPIHPMGAMISAAFLMVLLGTLWWMLHPPAYITQATARARQSVLSVKKILVPTVGLPHTERSVELACRLGDAQKAEIILTYVVEVPRTMPLGISLPEKEQAAKNALERATEIVSFHGLPTKSVIQHARVAGEDIAKAARKMDVDMIVLGIQKEDALEAESLSKTATILLKHATCEVIIDKLPCG